MSAETLTTRVDDPRVVALHRQMAEEMQQLYGEPRHAVGAETLDGMLDCWLVVDADVPVATASLRHLDVGGRAELEMKRLFVIPEMRGTGVAARLLELVEREAHRRGATRLLLHTGERQRAALALYSRVGYREIPVFAPYDSVPESVCLARVLASRVDRPELNCRAEPPN